MEDDQGPAPDSLLPYDEWTEEALRIVVLRALHYVAAHGLPGGHHFYITFRTDHPDTVIPPRLREQFKQEMTIVLQHQFWDLAVDEAAGMMSVGLSFGGAPAMLRIPLAAITAFTDPFVRHGMRFRAETVPVAAPESEAPESEAPESEAPAAEETPQVVSLDAFRRRTPPKE